MAGEGDELLDAGGAVGVAHGEREQAGPEGDALVGGVGAPRSGVGALGGGGLVAGGLECGPQRVPTGGGVALSAVAGLVGALDGACEQAAQVLVHIHVPAVVLASRRGAVGGDDRGELEREW